jgi:hypothetical protein
MPVWNNPTTEEEADAIIKMATDIIYSIEEDELETTCKELALFAGSFNHNWTRKHRAQLIDILVNVGDAAIDPVLQVLTDVSRVEQFDVTKTFIRRLVEKGLE